MKQCKQCKAVKGEADFYRDRSLNDGLKSYCKECSKAKVKEWKDENADRFREYRREYERQYKQNPDAIRKQAARRKLNNWVRLGHITRPDTCDHCGKNGLIEAHHHDYDKPLEVLWLCNECHLEEHR